MRGMTRQWYQEGELDAGYVTDRMGDGPERSPGGGPDGTRITGRRKEGVGNLRLENFFALLRRP